MSGLVLGPTGMFHKQNVGYKIREVGVDLEGNCRVLVETQHAASLLIPKAVLTCSLLHDLDGTARLHHWCDLRLAASQGKRLELARRDRQQHLLYRGFLAFWSVCRFPVAVVLY